MLKPFHFSSINRGHPLNDVLWHLTAPPTTDDCDVGVTIASGSAPDLEFAKSEAAKVVKAIHAAMKGA